MFSLCWIVWLVADLLFLYVVWCFCLVYVLCFLVADCLLFRFGFGFCFANGMIVSGLCCNCWFRFSFRAFAAYVVGLVFVVCGYGLRLFDLLFCGAVYVTWWWLFVWYAASWLCVNVVPLRLLRCVAGCS